MRGTLLTIAVATVAAIVVIGAFRPLLLPGSRPYDALAPDVIGPRDPPFPPPPPAPAVDVLLSLDVSDAIRSIDPRIYSFNYAQWAHPWDHKPAADPTFVAMVRQLSPALIRFPAGHWSQSTYWEVPGAPPPGPGIRHTLKPAEIDQLVHLVDATGAEPLIGINLKTGSPELAAAVVRYLNVERGFGVKWFELGNEPDLHDGRDSSPAAEADKFHRFAAAMRAVDPSIQLVGGVFMTGAHVTGTKLRPSWMNEFSMRVGNASDAYSWHWYPLDSDNQKKESSAYPSVEHLLQEHAPDWKPSGMSFAETACDVMERVRASTGGEHWITELGPDSGAVQAPGITDGQAAAVWIADALPRLATCGANAVFQFALRQQAASHLVLMRNDRQPTPMWAAYQLLAQNWQGAVLRVTESAPNDALAVHAARTPAGDLTVVLANKGATAITTAVRWEGAYPRNGTLWTAEADSPTAMTSRVNGERLTSDLIIQGLPGRYVDPWGAIEVPPYGVVVLRAMK